VLERKKITCDLQEWIDFNIGNNMDWNLEMDLKDY